MILEFSEVELYRRANVLVEKNEYERAIKIYRKLEEMYPTDWRYSNMIGYCHVHLGNPKLGREKFKDSLQKKGLKVTVYNNIAWSYLEEERYEDAAQLLSALIKDYPDDPHLHQNLGNALYGLEHYEEAITAFKKTLQINPHFNKCYFSLGLCFYLLLEYEDAQMYFELALEKDDTNRYDNQYFLAKCYFLNGHYEEHLEIAELLLDYYDEDVEILLDRAKSLIKLGYINEAMDELDYVLFLDMENEEAIALLHFLQAKKEE
ncbi:MAG: tetratricopeptide repeat protein [Bacillaceae bacterium]